MASDLRSDFGNITYRHDSAISGAMKQICTSTVDFLTMSCNGGKAVIDHIEHFRCDSGVKFEQQHREHHIPVVVVLFGVRDNFCGSQSRGKVGEFNGTRWIGLI